MQTSNPGSGSRSRSTSRSTSRPGGARAAWIACLFAIVVAVAPAQSRAVGITSEGGWGVLSAVSTIIYGPAKVCYAVIGLVFGGFAWGLSGGDSEVASAVVTPAVRGDYVVTPSHLRMERGLEFFGRDPAYRHASMSEETF